MSMLRTSLLLAALTGLFLVLGFLIGGQNGMLIALVFAIATNVFAYWNSDKMVLRMHGAQEVDAALGAGAVRPGAAAGEPGAVADAAGLHHRRGPAQRLRHRPRSASTPRSPSPPGCCARSAIRNWRASWRTSWRTSATATP